MWKIKQIFDGDYGCEETCSETGQAKEPMVSVTLVEEDTGENGKELIKYVTVPDRFLTEHGLEEGSDWRLTDQKPSKEYAFWGWENANVLAVSNDYPGIRTPWDLYDALSEIWCSETCAPRMRDGWTKENKTLGQCSITAFLAQDIFGGKVYGILRAGGNYHCYNVIGDCAFDLTSEQFGSEKLDYTENPEQSREVHFAKEENACDMNTLDSNLRSTVIKQTRFGGKAFQLPDRGRLCKHKAVKQRRMK